MKTTEIIAAQIKHINANIKDYILISIPLIFIIVFIQSVFFEKLEARFDNKSSLFENLILFLFLLYFAYYSYRFPVNVHRLVILNDRSSYYSFVKFKVTMMYFFCITLMMLFAAIVIFILPTIIVFPYFIFLFVFPFFALILPQAATGELTGLVNTVKKSKKVWMTILLQTLIIYSPLLFFWKVTEFVTVTPEYLNMIVRTIFSLITVYGFALNIGCLSQTYLLWKQEN